MKGGGSPSKKKCRQCAQQCGFVRKQQDLKRSRAGCRRKAGGCQGWNHSSCTSRSCEYGVAATAMLAVGVRKQQSKGSRRPPGSTRLIITPPAELIFLILAVWKISLPSLRSEVEKSSRRLCKLVIKSVRAVLVGMMRTYSCVIMCV